MRIGLPEKHSLVGPFYTYLETFYHRFAMGLHIKRAEYARLWRHEGHARLLACLRPDLAPLFRPQAFIHARWTKDWAKVSSELV